jgi:hypothetical protein
MTDRTNQLRSPSTRSETAREGEQELEGGDKEDLALTATEREEQNLIFFFFFFRFASLSRKLACV